MAGRTITPRLPSRFEDGESLPDDLHDARLIQIGIFGDAPDELELIIEYVPKGCETRRRMLFGFSDAAMWIERVN